MAKASSATIVAGVAGGVVATVTMDAAMVLGAWLAPEAFASDKISPEMIGRWAAGLARGRWRHEDVSAEAPVRGELWIGLAAHYLTGITLTQVYLAAAGRGGRRPDTLAAVAYGVATGALPLLLMYPSMGYGCCGRRSGDARRIVRAMFLGHVAFGAGIGAWTATRRRG